MKFEDIDSNSKSVSKGNNSDNNIYSSSDKHTSFSTTQHKQNKFRIGPFFAGYVSTILACLLIGFGIGFMYYNNIIGKFKVNPRDDESSKLELLGDETSADPVYKPDFVVPDPRLYKGIERQLAENAVYNSMNMHNDSKIVNILLLGSDDFNDDYGDGNSDTTMICSVNFKTKEIKLVSIMRDCYVYIPGKGFYKFNYACQAGGVELTIDTIEANFGIKIDRYAKVNFDGFVDIIDSLGGIKLDIQQKEVKFVNDSIKDYNIDHRLAVKDGALTESGIVNCTGKQALGYARIRNIGTQTNTYNDFGRTERQRIVVNTLVDKLKTQNLIQLNKVVETTSKYVKMNLDSNDIAKMMPKAPEAMKYPIVQGRIPQDDAYKDETITGIGEVLALDVTKTEEYIQNIIYGNQSANN